MSTPSDSRPTLFRVLDPVPADIALIGSSGADAVVLDVAGEQNRPSGPDGMRRSLAAQRAIVESVESRSGGATFPQLHVLVGRTAVGYDLDQVRMLCVPGLEAIHLPGADEPDQVEEVSTVLDLLEVAVGMPTGTVRLHPWLRTPRDVVGLGRALRASARMSAPVIDSAALAEALRIRDDASGLLAVRSQIVLESCAYGAEAPLEYLSGVGHEHGETARSIDPLLQIGFGGAVVR